jgi:PAS domain-containing protein
METKVKNEGPFNIPEGHLPMKNFLCSPIVFKNEVIGIISVANKEGGYGKEDIKLVEMICQTMAPILHEKLEREKTLGLLKQTRKAIFDMLNYANMYVLILDSNMSIKFINRSLVRLLGFERIKDVMNRCWLDFIEAEERERISVIHHHVSNGTEEAENFKEVRSNIVTVNGEKISLRWFNTQINTKYHWSFSIAIPESGNAVKITEESIRTYYEDVIKQDRTMILSLRDMIMNKTQKIIDSCEPGDFKYE